MKKAVFIKTCPYILRVKWEATDFFKSTDLTCQKTGGKTLKTGGK